MNGLLNVLKPPGMSSHDVVNAVRRIVSGKVGHTGTLDPLASGVLVLTIGAATRLTDLVALEDKVYRAELTFGFETATLDLEGEVVARGETEHITEGLVADALAGMVGSLQLPPPMYSAVKKGVSDHVSSSRPWPVEMKLRNHWAVLVHSPAPRHSGCWAPRM